MESVCESCNVTSVGTFQLMFSTLITSLYQSKCDIGVTYGENEPLIGDEEIFDFIVVGSGGAGSTVASRLSEVEYWNVLLIEAGPNPPFEYNIPGYFRSMQGSKYDWTYKLEPQKNACKAMIGGQCAWPTGKMLGGTSSIHPMIALRGMKRDYEHWESVGNEGWGYEQVLHYYKKLETFNFLNCSDNRKAHGYNGPLNIEAFKESPVDTFLPNLRKLILDTGSNLGVNLIKDFNAEQATGITFTPGTVQNGERFGAVRAHLAPTKDRKNLKVLKEAMVTKLLIKNKRVFGVEYLHENKSKQAYCSKEVIVSAGSANSPQLLMLSGIGPRHHLKDVAIEEVQNLNVGENLQDHVAYAGFPLLYTHKDDAGNLSPMDDLYEYLRTRSGLGAVGLGNTIMFEDTTAVNPQYPDVQILFYFFEKNGGIAGFLRGFNFDEEYSNVLLNANANHSILLPLVGLLRPKSRGKVLLHSKDPLIKPKIYGGYLDDREDMQVIIRGMALLKEFAETKPISKYVKQLDVTPSQCSHLSEVEKLECSVKYLTMSIHQICGTCKMGGECDSDAVVDPSLKVRGIKGLRVADESVMPYIISTNYNVPVYMIGEKAADMIKDEWKSVKN